MSKPVYFLGIDLGSSAVKITIFDASAGRSIDTVTYPEKEMKIISKEPGWAEQDPNYWWHCIESGLLKLKARNNMKDIMSIGVSYQMHGLVAIDSDGNPIIPSIIWCDSRAVEIGKKAEKKIKREVLENQILNSPGNFTASKLRWVYENDKDSFSKIYKIMLPGDFIAFKMTGKISTTPSGLSEGVMWDYHSNSVNNEILEVYDIDKSIIPDIVDNIGNQGNLSEEICDKFGFRRKIKISYRTGDQPNNAFSLNVLNPGEIAATAGTSAVVYCVTDKNIYDKDGRINTFIHCNNSNLKKRNGLLLCINGSGIAYSWIKSVLKESSYKEMDEKSEVIDDSRGLKFYPFGNGTERLFNNKNIGSHLVGLNFNTHNHSHIIRSTLEGIAFSMTYGIELLREFGVSVNTVRVGNANLFLSKLFRDAFVNSANVKLQLYDTNGSEGAARGAALGSGFYNTEKDAFSKLKMIKEIHPIKGEDHMHEYVNWKNFLNKLN